MSIGGLPLRLHRPVHEGAWRDGQSVSGTTLAHLFGTAAAGITLVLLLVFRLLSEPVARCGVLLERSAIGKCVLRRSFLSCVAASFAGALLTSVDPPFSKAPGTAILTTGIIACSLLLLTAAPLAFGAITDPRVMPTGRVRRSLRNFYARFGRHEVDGAWLEVLLAAALLITPPFVALLAAPSLRIETVILLGATLWALRRPLVDFEHGDSHYAFFRPRVGVAPVGRRLFRVLDWLSKYPLALATARIPNWYAVQHVSVHHAEDNGFADTQSTAPYDRASFVGFAACSQKFALSGMLPLDVVRYLLRKGRTKPLRRLSLGYATYVAWVLLLAAYSPGAALLLIGIRYGSLVADAASFFQEHGLVDPEHPEVIVTNSLHYIAADNDHGSRGEDYHIEHHLHPGLHWTLYPGAMAERLAAYEALQAIGFSEGTGQLRAYYRCLWRNDFAALASHTRVLGGMEMAQEEMEKLLRRRTTAAGPHRRDFAAPWIAQPAEWLAARLI